MKQAQALDTNRIRDRVKMNRKKDNQVQQDAFADIFILKNWIKNQYIDTLIAGAGGEYRLSFAGGTLRLKRLDNGDLSGELKSRSPRVLRVVKSMLADSGIVFV